MQKNDKILFKQKTKVTTFCLQTESILLKNTTRPRLYENIFLYLQWGQVKLSQITLCWMNQVIKLAFALKGFSQGFLSGLSNRDEMNEGQLTNDALLNVCGSKQPPLCVQVGKKNE